MSNEPATFWCSRCRMYHFAKCPKLSGERHEQLHEAQRRPRVKQNTERVERSDADKADIKRLKLKVNELVRERARLKAEIRALKTKMAAGMDGSGDIHHAILGVTNGRSVMASWKATIAIVHPDRHDGDPEADRLTALANAARDALS